MKLQGTIAIVKAVWLSAALLLCGSLGLFAQEAAETAAEELIAQRTQLALSNAGYPVTAGDRYTLRYAAAGGMSGGTGSGVTYPITVDASYRIRVSNLGVINAAGKTFLELKAEVEAMVAKNYPLSGPQLTLIQPASFTVTISGEVRSAEERTAWALDRLSAVLDDSLFTSYTSLRDVTITADNGQSRTYDLFKARRFGDLTENPYVRPGDRITLSRVSRVVSISGAVEREGAYQLLDGEHLRDLVTYYANGTTPLADLSRIEILRYVASSRDSGDKGYLTAADIEGNYALQDLDALYIPEITNLEPVMFVEGAIGVAANAAPTTANRETVRFNAGENYASLVRRNQGWFSAVSDTQNAYLLRADERIPINLNPMLYDSAYRSQYLVEDNDILIIPFRQYFVTVAGAVTLPGRYPYIPDRNWDYYIALAGGFDPNRNFLKAVTITDINGKKLGKQDLITPETIITAKTNAGLYYFNLYSPVIITTASIITAIFSIIGLFTSNP
jgi:protein involved in polysaccharide export with SLBB domain